MNSRKPKWSKWNLIDDADVWKVVALSLDIDPDKVTRDGGDWMAGGSYVNHEGNEFKDRVEVISANYQKIDATPKTLSMKGIEYCELNIPKFVSWAISVNWKIPDELKLRVKGESIVKAEKSLLIHETNLLKIQRLAISEFYEPRKNIDPKKEEVINWIKNKSKELKISVSDNMADAIFTIIKSDDHNPKIKRVEPLN